MILSGSRYALAALILFAGAGTLIYMTSREVPLQEAPLANTPEGTNTMLRIDVPAVRRSPLWQRFVVEPGLTSGLEALAERCGFDPLDQLHELTMFISGVDVEGLDHLGMIGRGPFEHERLAECLRAAAENQSMEMEEVELEGLPAVKMGEAGGEAESRIVFVGSEGMVWGEVGTATATVRAIRDESPSGEDDELLARLYDRVGRNREIVLVSRIPATWRTAAEAYVNRQQAGAGRMLEPYFGTTAVGAGIRVSRGLAIGAILVADTPENAEGMAQDLQRQLDQVMRHPLIGISPLGGALRRIRINQNGNDVNLAFDLPQERIDRLLGMLDTLSARGAGVNLPPGVVPGLVPPDRLPPPTGTMAPDAPAPESEMAPEAPAAPAADMAAPQ